MTQEIIEKPMSAECTMKQYEAIPDTDFVENREYQLIDYPDNGANAEQMAYALTCKRLFPADTVVTFSGTTDTNYTNGHLYQIQVDTSGIKSWKDITLVSEQSIPIITGTQEKPINLYSDLEVGKYYFLQGYIRNTSSSNVLIYNNETAKMLVFKLDTTLVKAYNCYWFSSEITNKPVNTILLTNTSGDISNNSYQSLEIRQFNHSASRYQGPVTIFAPDVSGEDGQILKAIKGNKPYWVDPLTIATKQQTYYLTGLPTITTSPYAEHDQVVVNNQDVYALESVGGTLNWVKKYSVGGGDESIITLIGTQEKPILFSNMITGGIYVLKGYLKLTDNTTQNLDRPLLCQKIWDSKIVIWNAHRLITDETLAYLPGTMVILNITGDVYTSTTDLSAIGEFNGSIPNNIGKFVDFYAPTTSGIVGQILRSNGSGKEPIWIDNSAPFVLDITDLTTKISDANIIQLDENKVAYIRYTQTDSEQNQTAYLYKKDNTYREGNVKADGDYMTFSLDWHSSDSISLVSNYLKVYISEPFDQDWENPIEKGSIVQVTQKALLTPSGTPTNGQLPMVQDNKLTWANLPTSGQIKTITYDNTTLGDHIADILQYINVENGGTLLSIGFKTGTASVLANATKATITNGANPTVATSSEAVLKPATFYSFRSADINKTGNVTNLTLNGPNGLTGCSSTNIEITSDSSTETPTNTCVADGCGQNVNADGAVEIITFKGVNLLSIPLEHLVIDYFIV